MIEVVCIDSKAYYALIDEFIKKIETYKNDSVEEWIDEKQAMKILTITSKTTLQKLRDNGNIRFSKLTKKNILYNKKSIFSFIEENANYSNKR